MEKIDLAIFDVDGTLLDTAEGIISSVRYTSEQCGFPLMGEEEIASVFIGPPIECGFHTAFGIDGERLAEAVSVFREHYINYDLFRAKPYEGIYEVLDCLINSEIKIAIATYKRQDYAEKLLSHFGFDRYTRNIHGADFQKKFKKFDLILQCIFDSRVCKNPKVLMIGDGESDLEGAKAAGVEFLGVTYGYGFSPSKIYEFAVSQNPKNILTYLKLR